MRYSIKTFLIAVSLVFTGASAAQAEVFYWQDAHTKMSVTVPDTWRLTSNQLPDDQMTVLAPGNGEYAACRLRAREDRRFLVYPQRYSGAVQRKNFSKDFWSQYVAEFPAGELNSVTDNAGLGRGFASWADISFIADGNVQKRGLAFVSLYNDTAYIMECSAEASVYDQWHNAFLNVAKSVDFRKVIHEFPAGNYRDFLGDGAIEIRGERPIDTRFY
jgi:hypothetical protein